MKANHQKSKWTFTEVIIVATAWLLSIMVLYFVVKKIDFLYNLAKMYN